MTDMLFRSPERLAIPSVTANQEPALPNAGDATNVTYHYPHLPAYLPSSWRYPNFTNRPGDDNLKGDTSERKSPVSASSPSSVLSVPSGLVSHQPDPALGRGKRSFETVTEEEKPVETIEKSPSPPKRLKVEEDTRINKTDSPPIVHKSSPEGSPLSAYDNHGILGKCKVARCFLVFNYFSRLRFNVFADKTQFIHKNRFFVINTIIKKDTR